MSSLNTPMTAAVLCLLVLAASGRAQEQEPLDIGDPAPELPDLTWFEGEPVDINADGEGPIIVLDFWSITCGFCLIGIPELTDLQAQYGPDRLRIVGIAEDAPGNPARRVKKYLDRRGEEMGYAVAYDHGRKAWSRYMDAAGETGIPCVFVIDPNGRIAWIGHPESGLARVIARMVEGTHDVEFERQWRAGEKVWDRAWRDGDGDVVAAHGDRMIEYDPQRMLGWHLKASAAARMAQDESGAQLIIRDAIDALRAHPRELARFLRQCVFHPRTPGEYGATVLEALGPVLEDEHAPPEVRIWAVRAALEEMPGEDAAEAARRVMWSIPPESLAMYDLARLLLWGEPDAPHRPVAAEAIRRAYNARPHSAEVAYLRFIILSRLGEDEPARTAARTYIDLIANDPWTLHEFAWWDLLEDEGGPERFAREALLAAEQMCATYPPDANRLDTLALAQFRCGDVEGAIATQKHAVRIAPPDEIETYRQKLAEYEAAAGAVDEGTDRPNFVFILIDDLGWTDVGFMGSNLYETPRIDRLAAEGMVFTDAYANAPNCAPSRACLLTGLYTPRHGVYTVNSPARGKAKNRKLIPTPNTKTLAPSFTTIAEALKGAGYACASIGKWHLGQGAETGPLGQGFDVNIGGHKLGHPKSYFSPYKNPELEDGEKGEHLTDRLTDEAIAFIEANRDKPFFLYLPYYAVHTPIQAKKDLAAKYADKIGDGPGNAEYAAMIETTDQNVGRLMDALDEMELAANTVVFFFSDNGGYAGVTSNAPLRGFKGMLYEGGIREPMIVRWPEKIAAGGRCDVPVIGTDFFPTMLEMASVEKPEQLTLDGLSLMPLLAGTGELERRPIFWHFPAYLESGRGVKGLWRTTPAGAVRLGDWKLIEFFEDGRLELYNLAEDIGERNDLSKVNPEKTAELHALLRAWRESVDAPAPTERNPKYKSPD